MDVTSFHYAVRNLSRAPRYALACVFTLAFAFAGTTTFVNMLEAIVFRRLAVSAPDRLIGIYPTTGDFSVGFSSDALRALGDRQEVLTGICGVTAGYGTLGVQFDSGPARQRPVEAVTGNCYELLGVTAAVGRVINSADATLTGDPERVVVISNRIWRQNFAASPDVVGRTVRVEGTPLTIIGVFPAAYGGVNADEAPDVAVPITLLWKLRLHPPLAMYAVGRLHAGIGFGQAAAHLRAIWPGVFKESLITNATPIPTLRTVPLASGFSILRERYRHPLYALGALAVCLLLLACANVGGLSLARLLDRRNTFAVQLALGAGRSRLAAQLLCEAQLIGGIATLVAIPIARWGATVAAGSLWTGYRPFTIPPTPLSTTVLIATLIGMLASLFVAMPGWIALFAQNWDLSARSVGTAPSGYRRGMVGTQIALCFVLTFCAALFIVNLSEVRRLPLGFEPDRLQFVRLDSTTRNGFAPTIGYADTLLEKMEALPGVELAAMSQGGFGSIAQVIDAVPVRSSGGGRVDALTDQVSPGFFRTTSIAVRHGRDFTWTDVNKRAAVAILSESLANRLFPGVDGVGRTIKLGESEQLLTVVGISADASPGDPRIRSVPQCYLPLGPIAPPAPALLLRLKTGTVTEASLRALVEPLGRHQVLRVSMMHDQTERFLVQERLITFTSSFFAALAIAVSISGLYATMSQNIIRRTREIGIRIAVGATPAMIRALVLADTGWILVVGLSLGVPAAFAGGQVARSLLSVTPTHTLLLLAVTGFATGGGALLASAWPAQRAATVPVATALRCD